MRALLILVSLITAGAFAGGCTRTKNGDLVLKTPIGVSVTTRPDTLRMPNVSIRRETVSTPTVETRTETLIVKKPVIGSEKREVNTPVLNGPKR